MVYVGVGGNQTNVGVAVSVGAEVSVGNGGGGVVRGRQAANRASRIIIQVAPSVNFMALVYHAVG